MFLDEIADGVRFDSKVLKSVLTSEQYKGRLLGVSKPVTVGTRVLVVFTGCSLNLGGQLPSRTMLIWLDTGRERASERSNSNFRIPDLKSWSVEHRQEIVAAVFTIVRAYLAECRRCGGTPADVAKRRGDIDGSRFGGRCEFLRDVMLWAFPELPDPFLGFRASEEASSTKAEKAYVLHLLDRRMQEWAGQDWAKELARARAVEYVEQTPEYNRWEAKFKARWDRLPTAQRFHHYGTGEYASIKHVPWDRIRNAAQIRSGRRMVRSGRTRFTATEILGMCPEGDALRNALEGVLPAKQTLNPITLGRWLSNQLAQAPIDGKRLRRSVKHQGGYFWVERV
jgi:hypothetical protein